MIAIALLNDGDTVAADARTIRQALRNGGALFLAYVLPKGCTLASIVVAARILGTADFGAFGTAAAFAFIFSLLVTLGMVPLLVREIARDRTRAPALMYSAHLVKTGASGFMLGGLVILAAVLDYSPEVTRAALVLGIGNVLWAYAENLSAYFQAIERMSIWTQASALYGVVSGVLGIAIIMTTRDLVLFCAAPALGWLAGIAWLLAKAPPEVRFGTRTSGKDVRALLASLAPFAAAFILMAVYYKVDVLLLAHWRSQEEVGLYVAGYKFIDFFQALALVATAAVYPHLSRAALDRGNEGWAGGRSTELMLLGAVPCAGVLFLLADSVVGTVFGPGYAAASAAVRLLALVLPFLAVTIHGGYVLAAAGRMGAVAALYAVAVVLNVSANSVWIPSRGATGAASAMLLSEAILAAGFLWTLQRTARAAPRARVLLAAASAMAAAGLLRSGPAPNGGLGPSLVFLVITAGLYLLFGVVSSGDWVRLSTAMTGNGTEPESGGPR